MKETKSEMLRNVTGVKNSKIIDNNTLKIEYSDGKSAIRLHQTDVVTFDKNKIILNSGGWRTVTTKERINRFSPANITQIKGIWYLNGEPFYDGCVINQSGKLISKKIKINYKRLEMLKRQISKYCNLITKDNLLQPESGDCWNCSLRTKEGIPMGELGSKDYEHLHSHLKENYLHGSILVNAMREAGYSYHAIGVHYYLKTVDTFKRALRRYLQKRLISNIAVK